MSNTINYQPWLQAVLNIAKHYRIEPSEERIRLQLDWDQHKNADELVAVMARQIGLSVRKNKYDINLLNPWRLPVLVEFISGEVGVVERIDVDGNASVQLSGDEGLSQVFSIERLSHGVRNIYILRPESSVPDARVDEYIKPFEKNWFWSIVLKDWKRYIDIMF
ncbi:MAG: type I secretion system permease/ATPase, partial [Acinetobacter amyesii]